MKRITVNEKENLVLLQDWELKTIHCIVSQHCRNDDTDNYATEIMQSLEDVMYGIYHESEGQRP